MHDVTAQVEFSPNGCRPEAGRWIPFQTDPVGEATRLSLSRLRGQASGSPKTRPSSNMRHGNWPTGAVQQTAPDGAIQDNLE